MERVTAQRVAGLHLRGRHVRVVWPDPAGDRAPAMLVLLPGVTGELAERLRRRAGVVVLSPSWRNAPLDDAAATLDWAAEHGAEIGGDTQRLAVAGAGAGATLAATLALRARDLRWPALARQVLIHPGRETSLLGPLAGVAPATVLTSPRGDGGRLYAARLLRAGVEVEALDSHGDLADSLRRALR
jgi:acetyl esterase/lipase